MLQIFIAIIVIAFMLLFAAMSLPMFRDESNHQAKHKSNHQPD